MEALEVSARWDGGYAVGVEARGHRIAVDEPHDAGGEDGGMMPTEVFLASLASCFCLALAHVAGKRDLDLPGLEVKVQAERAGRELRYGRFVVEASADVEDGRLEALMEPARRVCWVSNTVAAGAEYEYRTTGATSWASD